VGCLAVSCGKLGNAMLVADSFHSEQFSCVQLKGDDVAVGGWYAIAKDPL